ncbi:hypothetical protein [Streptosporangium carneum]|uniref:Uncharacterized protein n=1 Tax=Streptosporangium carneum TaxID=47481 RepID=A0A9W6IBF3_9ACTN|nr:hypothetical protein [Streptosporangium carneum]GLK14494.1 hypothetical protein GCM10017600_79060 [Streptosporangium carneum]
MWRRGLDWGATTLVGVFGVLWSGVVVFAAAEGTMWTRLGQGAFGAFLIGWSLYKAAVLLRPSRPRAKARHRRVRA